MNNPFESANNYEFFDEKVLQANQKKGIRNLNIEELELRAVLKLMENKFS